jgi:hypothetical protein
MTRASILLRVSTVAAVGIAALGATALPRAPSAAAPTVTVYKSASCGCCGKWIAHLREAGFTVVAYDTEDLPSVRTNMGVPFRLTSCHTARVGKYVVEGHVPADLIQRLLAEHPALAGLSVPGMVTGSPGMEGPGAEPYDVIAWDRDGKTTVYARR